MRGTFIASAGKMGFSPELFKSDLNFSLLILPWNHSEMMVGAYI
jgi:hypothetical protein